MSKLIQAVHPTASRQSDRVTDPTFLENMYEVEALPSIEIFRQELAYAEQFTLAYQSHLQKSAREAACLAVMLPEAFREIAHEDELAGRFVYPRLRFSPEARGMGYICEFDWWKRCRSELSLTKHERALLDEIINFWREEETVGKAYRDMPADLAQALPERATQDLAVAAVPLWRIAGLYLNYEKLLKLGLAGLQAEVRSKLDDTAEADRQWMLALIDVLETMRAICRSYAQVAGSQSKVKMCEALGNIADDAPASFREALQLAWLYSCAAGVLNYGRIDVWAGRFLLNDLQAGKLSEAEAEDLLEAFWLRINERHSVFNGRLILGGKDRKDIEAADQLAHLAMNVTERLRAIEPQLSLRVYDGLDSDVLKHAMHLIGQGLTYPMLYNDEINIPAAMKSFGVSEQIANEYIPYGCGEIVLDYRSVGTPNGLLNLAVVMEQLIAKSEAATFEDFILAYEGELKKHLCHLARVQKLSYEAMNNAGSLLLASALYDDCLSSGKALMDGGVQHLGGTVELYGHANAADMAIAIKAAIFDDKRYSWTELRELLRVNFEGREKEWQWLVSLPKFGNDHEAADGIAARLHEMACRICAEQGKQVGLDSYLPVVVNNWANTHLGRYTGATPDGRKSGLPLANGMTPQSGMDREGITAMMNSIVKMSPDLQAGMVTNLKLGKDWFTAHAAKSLALVQAYFASGGTHLMISVTSREELEEALVHPENYGYLMVRVGGFSARFIDLPRDCQHEILNRTCY